MGLRRNDTLAAVQSKRTKRILRRRLHRGEVQTQRARHAKRRARLRRGAGLVFTLDFRVFLGGVALADQFGMLQIPPLGALQRALGVAGLLVDLAGLDKALLGLIVFTSRGAVALA